MRQILILGWFLVAPACVEHDAGNCETTDCESLNHVGPDRTPQIPDGGGGQDAAPDTDADASGGSVEYPCEVEQVLAAKCWRCHQDPQQNGAPFSLLRHENTRAPYGSRVVWEVIENAVETDFMPATFLDALDPPVEGLTPEEKQVLLDWVRNEAPPAGPGEACEN